MTQFSRPLLALIMGQICLHSCMAGVRVAGPLLALRSGQPTWAVGVLMGLFAAAPVLSSLYAGRLADRRGYHRPVRLAVWMTVLGGLIAVLATEFLAFQFPLLCVAAALCGVGTNFGLIAIQRTAGRLAEGDRAALTRIFSWLGLAPMLTLVRGRLPTVQHRGARRYEMASWRTHVEFWYAPDCTDRRLWNSRFSGPSSLFWELTAGVL